MQWNVCSAADVQENIGALERIEDNIVVAHFRVSW